MSSLTRRMQIRMFKRSGKSKVHVVNAKGDVLVKGGRWPRNTRQLFWLYNTPIYPGDTHPVLQPLIDLLTPKTT